MIFSSFTSKILKKKSHEEQFSIRVTICLVKLYHDTKFELMDTAVLRYLPSLIIFTKGIPIKRRNSKNFILIKIETIVLLVCLFALLLADMLTCLLPY